MRSAHSCLTHTCTPSSWIPPIQCLHHLVCLLCFEECDDWHCRFADSSPPLHGGLLHQCAHPCNHLSHHNCGKCAGASLNISCICDTGSSVTTGMRGASVSVENIPLSLFLCMVLLVLNSAPFRLCSFCFFIFLILASLSLAQL